MQRLADRFSLTRWDLGVLAWLVVSRLAIILAVYPDRNRMFNGDSPLYEGLALSLMAGEGYVYGPHEPFSDLIRPPGYPLFVFGTYLLFGPSPLSAIIWNVAFVALVYLGIRSLLRRMGQAIHPAVGVVFGVDLGWLLYSKELLTEPLFTALLLGGLLLLIDGVRQNSSGRILGSGIVVGLTALIKPITLYLPVVLVPWIVGVGWRSRRSFGRTGLQAGLLVLGALLMVTPWMARNAMVHGTPTFTSIQASNLLGGHAAFVYADRHELTHLEAQARLNDEVSRRLADRYGSVESAPFAALEEVQAAVASEVLVAHPLRYLRAILRGVGATLFDPGRLVVTRTFAEWDRREIGLTNTLARDGVVGTLRHLMRDDPVRVGVLLGYLAFLGAVFVVAVAGMPSAFRSDAALAWLCLLVGAYLLALGGPHGYARFRLYVFPFLLIALHFGVVALRARLRRRSVVGA